MAEKGQSPFVRSTSGPFRQMGMPFLHPSAAWSGDAVPVCDGRGDRRFAGQTLCRLPVESVERFSGDLGKVREELDAAGVRGGKGDSPHLPERPGECLTRKGTVPFFRRNVYVVCQTKAEVRRLADYFAETQLARPAAAFRAGGSRPGSACCQGDRAPVEYGAVPSHRRAAGGGAAAGPGDRQLPRTPRGGPRGQAATVSPDIAA